MNPRDTSAPCRRYWGLIAQRWASDRWDRDPLVRRARLPAPPARLCEIPAAVPIRSPSPRIGRNPGVSEAGVPNPCARREWVPPIAGEVRAPATPEARVRDVAAVIVQIAKAICVLGFIVCVVEVAGMVAVEVLVPLVVWPRLIRVGHVVVVLIKQVKTCRAALG